VGGVGGSGARPGGGLELYDGGSVIVDDIEEGEEKEEGRN
jgi:hypothetical protein